MTNNTVLDLRGVQISQGIRNDLVQILMDSDWFGNRVIVILTSDQTDIINFINTLPVRPDIFFLDDIKNHLTPNGINDLIKQIADNPDNTKFTVIDHISNFTMNCTDVYQVDFVVKDGKLVCVNSQWIDTLQGCV